MTGPDNDNVIRGLPFGKRRTAGADQQKLIPQGEPAFDNRGMLDGLATSLADNGTRVRFSLSDELAQRLEAEPHQREAIQFRAIARELPHVVSRVVQRFSPIRKPGSSPLESVIVPSATVFLSGRTIVFEAAPTDFSEPFWASGGELHMRASMTEKEIEEALMGFLEAEKATRADSEPVRKMQESIKALESKGITLIMCIPLEYRGPENRPDLATWDAAAVSILEEVSSVVGWLFQEDPDRCKHLRGARLYIGRHDGLNSGSDPRDLLYVSCEAPRTGSRREQTQRSVVGYIQRRIREAKA